MTDTASTTTVTAADARRAGVIAGLRALADFLDQHPDLPTPNVQSTVYPRGESDAAECAAVDAIAAVLDVPAKGSTHYTATRMFGAVLYQACAITREEIARWHALTSYQGVIEPDSETDR